MSAMKTLSSSSLATQAPRPCLASPCSRLSAPRRTRVVANAGTNYLLELLVGYIRKRVHRGGFSAAGSTAAVTVPAAVTIATSEYREKEIEKVQTLEGALPLIGAVVADSVAHSIPGLNLIFGLISEPAGAAAGVAYMMSILLSAAAIDPSTLAPKGTVLNAEKSADAVTAAVRVPFTAIIPTTLKVIDYSNEGSSGAAWKVVDGLPKLPINSVLIILGVGTLILEAASHAPVLSTFMPRVLSVAGWLAAVGWGLELTQKKEETSS